ncbi:hypothetical protein X832_gp112 [Pseudomonas phage PAK_P5]|uniref:Uncharacterized protein n=1 Tax=Pseudomonas phage PAK_P5 TaxID=1327964 RepID=V5JXW1_9CAUD|nr:hypothetical protein X832_gp112 [Pseudomonas phage PAK_P5]AGR89582.1 hypothetical protein PAK_P500112c [Pseudomonas phage PAK_P5]
MSGVWHGEWGNIVWGVNCVTQARCLSLASLKEACQFRGGGKPIV